MMTSDSIATSHGYLSAYLKQHQAEHYRRLSAIRGDGDWEGWVSIFLEGVAAASADAERSIIDVASLITADRQRRRQAAGGSRHPGRAHWAEEEPRLQLPGLRGPALPVTGPHEPAGARGSSRYPFSRNPSGWIALTRLA